nr:putative Snf2 family helicase [Oceanusvirus sp.]
MATVETDRDFVRLVEAGGMRPEMAARLKPYQKGAVLWFHKRYTSGISGAFLAFDMGLGKTPTSIAIACLLRSSLLSDRRTSGHPIVVVAPASTVHDTWVDHFEMWTTLSCAEIKVADMDRHGLPESDVYILTHDALGQLFKRSCGHERDTEMIQVKGVWTEKKVWRKKFECEILDLAKSAVIYDEAHELRNPHSLRNRGGQEMLSPFNVMSSGTPLNNSPMDICAVCRVAGIITDPSIWKKMKRRINKTFVVDFRQRYIYRLTEDCLDPPLPQCVREKVSYHLASPEEVEAYNIMLAEAENAAKAVRRRERDDDAIMILLAAIGKLKRCMFHPALADTSMSREERIVRMFENGSSKMLAAANGINRLLFSLGHKKIIVVSDETTQLVALREFYRRNHGAANGAKSLLYDGTLDRTKRQQVLNTFRNVDEARILYLSLKAGGTGLNLTEATGMLFVGLWYNREAHNQAYKRIHRIGQTSVTNVLTLCCTPEVPISPTFEESVLDLHQDKSRAFESIVNGDFAWADGAAKPDKPEWKVQMNLLKNLKPLVRRG